jgi:rRNA maturation RNase YbeY
MPVSFYSQETNFKISGKKRVIDWLLLVCYLEKAELNDVSYVFCTDEYLLQLNKNYLRHATYTDVITFDYSKNNKISAEIYISPERVQENAFKYKSSPEEELRRVMIHGVLHCIGYNDKTIASKVLMRKKEKRYLQLFHEV